MRRSPVNRSVASWCVGDGSALLVSCEWKYSTQQGLSGVGLTSMMLRTNWSSDGVGTILFGTFVSSWI